MDPSGKDWPLPGTPVLNALIIVGFATITLSISVVRADETSAQSSYPLKSESAIPPGDTSEYLPLSWPCAKRAIVPRTATPTRAIATTGRPVGRPAAVRVSIFRSCGLTDFIERSGIVCSPHKQVF